MSLALADPEAGTEESLISLVPVLEAAGRWFGARADVLPRAELVTCLESVEALSRTLDYLQAVGAAAAERQRIAGIGVRIESEPAVGCDSGWGHGWSSGSGMASGAGWGTRPDLDSDTSPGTRMASGASAGQGSDTDSDSSWGIDSASDTPPGIKTGAGIHSGSPSDQSALRQQNEFRDTADYLRARLRITRAEARRRIRLGLAVTGQPTLTGDICPPRYEVLAAAFATGVLGADAALQVHDGVDRARTNAEPAAVLAMEECLTAQAVESDGDLLRVVTRRWECALDPDGREPTEETLRAQQGVFVRGRRRGLQRLEIAADDEQFEYLLTAMNTATNPRLRTAAPGSAPLADGTPGTASLATDCSGPDGSDSAEASDLPETRTRPQLLLDGLVGACQVALATDTLPATGGHRPQVMVTIDYRTLMGQLHERAGGTARARGYRPDLPSMDRPIGRSGGDGTFTADSGGGDPRSGPSISTAERLEPPPGGYSVFGGPMSASVVRKMACDADIIPIVLGGQGEILDAGRARRLFGVAQRRALVARDRGCAFPSCTIPAVWTEAHHITPWTDGGPTDVSNGCLLCSFHHRLIEQGNWVIEVKEGLPWFIPPPYLDPRRVPRRNEHRELAL
ncbi:DUF222 domain-containing protein [Arthrobacter sp. Soc17.1.1.1]|uniref:HNH endonuclease signature motif containing protein n=1 Tax=Arthrobacter sp. Soc17.1.1.1 TaxID=3121277 RepID=UPI002FE4E8CC